MMKKWPKIFSVLLLLSLMTQFPVATFRINMPQSTQRGIEQVLLEAEIATQETIAIEMEKVRADYKENLTQSKRMKAYARSTVWWILLICALGLLCSKQWAYYRIYIVTTINLYTTLPYCPLTELLSAWIFSSIPILQIINFLMVGFLVRVHLKTNRIPNQQVEPVAKTPVDEVEAQGSQAHP